MRAAPFHLARPAATRSGVIPAKAGIHTVEFAGSGTDRASRPEVSTSNAPAEWIPAFAGMTAEDVVSDAALPPGAIRDLASRAAVIPAKAGIHAATFAQADETAASTPKVSAVWIPAFAGMTTERIGPDAALSVPADAASPRRDRLIARRFTNSRAR